MTRKASFFAAAVALSLMTGSAVARDFGYGGRYSAHLDPYDGRPLGPPLTAYGSVYNDADPYSLYAPRFDYVDRQFVVTGPYGPKDRAGRKGRVTRF
jgi:hypothetical protein